MDLAELTAKASEAMSANGSDFTKTIKLDFGDEGKLFIDGEAGTASNDDPGKDFDAIITVSWENFKKIAKREVKPAMLYMRRALKFEGDMSVIDDIQKLTANIA